jgi:hypothetical protein
MNNEINVTAIPGEDPELARARTVTRPEVTNARTLQAIEANLELQALVDTLTHQTQAVAGGDLTRSEEMLAAQAHTLDALFNHLARRALSVDYMDHLDTYLKMALRAQSQCRATWETLSVIKNPPMVGYIRQANIAGGHQQVNNGPGESSRARENVNTESKLLEVNHGQRLDFGTTGTSSGVDTEMATVGEKLRTENGGG